MKHSKKNCVASPDDKLMIRLILDRISPYTGKYEPEESRILACFTQCLVPLFSLLRKAIISIMYFPKLRKLKITSGVNNASLPLTLETHTLVDN